VFLWRDLLLPLSRLRSKWSRFAPRSLESRGRMTPDVSGQELPGFGLQSVPTVSATRQRRVALGPRTGIEAWCVLSARLSVMAFVGSIAG
jgi:hypothetical protein